MQSSIPGRNNTKHQCRLRTDFLKRAWAWEEMSVCELATHLTQSARQSVSGAVWSAVQGQVIIWHQWSCTSRSFKFLDCSPSNKETRESRVEDDQGSGASLMNRLWFRLTVAYRYLVESYWCLWETLLNVGIRYDKEQQSYTAALEVQVRHLKTSLESGTELEHREVRNSLSLEVFRDQLDEAAAKLI